MWVLNPVARRNIVNSSNDVLRVFRVHPLSMRNLRPFTGAVATLKNNYEELGMPIVAQALDRLEQISNSQLSERLNANQVQQFEALTRNLIRRIEGHVFELSLSSRSTPSSDNLLKATQEFELLLESFTAPVDNWSSPKVPNTNALEPDTSQVDQPLAEPVTIETKEFSVVESTPTSNVETITVVKGVSPPPEESPKANLRLVQPELLIQVEPAIQPEPPIQKNPVCIIQIENRFLSVPMESVLEVGDWMDSQVTPFIKTQFGYAEVLDIRDYTDREKNSPKNYFVCKLDDEYFACLVDRFIGKSDDNSSEALTPFSTTSLKKRAA